MWRSAKLLFKVVCVESPISAFNPNFISVVCLNTPTRNYMTGVVAQQEEARLRMSSKTASFLDVASVDNLTAQEASLEVLEAVASLHISSSPMVQATHVAGVKLGSVCNLLGDQKALQEHENEMAEVSVVQSDDI